MTKGKVRHRKGNSLESIMKQFNLYQCAAVAAFLVCDVLCLGAVWPPAVLGADRLGPGVSYRVIRDEDKPLSIHVLEIDRAQADLYLTASVGATIKGKETVPKMAAAMPKDKGVALAAVNGGYFEFTKEPRFFGVVSGISIIEGELLSGPRSTSLCFDGKGKPSIRRAASDFHVTWPDGATAAFGLNRPTADYDSDVKGTPLVIFTPAYAASTGVTQVREIVLGPADPKAWLPLRANQTFRAKVVEVRTEGDTPIASGTLVLTVSRKAEASTPVLKPGDELIINTAFSQDMSDVVTAISGEPQLLKRGEEPASPDPDRPGSRAPRTLVGYNDERIYFAVVDGRQKELSRGMSFAEASAFMRGLGCNEAINMDGGGSSTFWLAGHVMNSSSDGAPRAVGDCLVLMRRQAKQ